MKNKFLIIISLIITVIFCSVFCIRLNDNENRNTHELPYSVENLSSFEWEEYEFTKDIPKPQKGIIQSVSALRSEDGDRYHLDLCDISSEDSDEYIELLKKHGYKVLASESNSVSTGVCLIRDKVYLSIAYSDGILGMLIDNNVDASDIVF